MSFWRFKLAEKTAALFFKRSSVWKGPMTNFVNMKGRIVQHAHMIMEISTDSEGIVTQKNIVVKPDGTRTSYEGIAKMRVEGNRVVNAEPMTEDPNTKNKIQNHLLEGYIGDNHIYILESYDEILPEGKVEHRRNDVHYYFFNNTEMVILADVFVNGKLLVFANTRLKRIK